FVNLTKNIAVEVTLIKANDLKVTFSESTLRTSVENVLSKGGLSLGGGNSTSGKPPLPMFNLLVLLYPIQEGYVADCQIRLFEEVTLARVQLNRDTAFQAITWEQQNLVVGPKDEFEKL